MFLLVQQTIPPKILKVAKMDGNDELYPPMLRPDGQPCIGSNDLLALATNGPVQVGPVQVDPLQLGPMKVGMV